MKVPPAELRKASGSFAASGGSLSDYGVLSASLRDFARANAQIYPTPPGSGGTAEIPFGQIASMLGQAQSRSLSQGASAFTGRITSDQGQVTLSGFETGPSFSASAGNFSPGVAGVHATALIQRLNMVLYVGSASVIQGLTEKLPASMPERIRAIVHVMVDHWREKIYPNMPEAAKKVASQIHELNSEPLRILDRILENSTPHEISGLAELADKAPLVNLSVNNWIFRSLTGNKEDFWASFLGLADSLGMLYAPEFGGAQNNGRLFGLKEAFADKQDRTELSAVSWQNALVLPEVPVTHVVVPRVSGGHLRGYVEDSDMLPGQTLQTFVRFPKDKFDGRAFILNVPPFLGPVFQNVGATAAWESTINPGQHKAGIQKQAANVIVATDALREFMTGLARRTLHLLQMQGVTASVSVPLDPSWEVGKVYDVGIGGTKMFSGLLATCQHAVSSSASSPQAFTKLAFNHVQWGDFSLPFD